MKLLKIKSNYISSKYSDLIKNINDDLINTFNLFYESNLLFNQFNSQLFIFQLSLPLSHN